MNNKELLKQYVDTGLQLPEYQVKSLTDKLRNTYIRKRLIAVERTGGFLDNYEFESLTPEQRFQVVMKLVERGYKISDDQFELLTPEQRSQYRIKMAQKNDFIPYEQLKLLPQEDRLEIFMILYPNEVSSKKFELLTPEQQKIYKDKGGIVY